MSAQTSPKTVYIAYMCDHCYVLAAGLEATGQPAMVLPKPDEETLAIGLSFCRGRECSPCLTVSGDMARLARNSDFDPERSILLMATTTGSCRFGQYVVLLHQIMEQLGMGAVEILSPSANDSYGLGNDPLRARRLIWEGLVAVDLLQKLLHRYRPYELSPGATDVIYQSCLDQVVAATRAGGGKRLVAAMEAAAEAFAGLAVDDSNRRPLIGLVGEIYLRHNSFSNLEIIRRVEALGGEIELASMMEWFYYTNWGHAEDAWLLGMPVEWARTVLTDRYQRVLERRLARPVAHLLDHPYETPVARLMAHVQPYFSTVLANECLLSMGKTVELGRLGICGMINVMPFACMPGTITAGMAPRIRGDFDGLPWLDIAFDAQGGTNITTRMEAFMYQAAERRRRFGNAQALGH